MLWRHGCSEISRATAHTKTDPTSLTSAVADGIWVPIRYARRELSPPSAASEPIKSAAIGRAARPGPLMWCPRRNFPPQIGSGYIPRQRRKHVKKENRDEQKWGQTEYVKTEGRYCEDKFNQVSVANDNMTKSRQVANDEKKTYFA